MNAIYLLAVALLLGTGTVKEPSGPHISPAMADGAKLVLEGPPLTGEKVESFIACLTTLQSRFGGADRTDPPEDAEVLPVLAEFGFATRDDWIRTVLQVGMGYSVATMASDQLALAERKYQEARQQMGAAEMPGSVKENLMKMVEAMPGSPTARENARAVEPYLDQLRPLIEAARAEASP